MLAIERLELNSLLIKDYTDDEEEEQPDVDMENSYYEAKGLKESNPRAAIAKFEHVSALKLFEEDTNDLP